MIKSIDQMGNQIVLKQSPTRIVSLVPSQSEYLWELGLQEELVGISKFCIHPKTMFNQVKRVGGTKTLDLELIRSLNPDLILGNKEENHKESIDLLRNEYAVWMSDVNAPEQAIEMMMELGKLVNRSNQATKIVTEVQQSLVACKSIFSGESVAYFIWKNPYYLAASHTFIDSILNLIGLKNVCHADSRYPEYSLEKLNQLNPEFCFLSSEPFPFKSEHVLEIQSKIPSSKVILVDGEMFSWYGSRLISLSKYLIQLKKEIYA